MRAGLVPPLVCLAACASGVSATDSLLSDLRVQGGQFFMGAEPASSSSGPTAIAPQTTINSVLLGQLNFQLSGELSPNAAAVAFQLEGDVGYWTLAAQPNNDLAQPQNLSFSTKLSFNPDSQLPDGGALVLDISAIDAAGEFGPPSSLNLSEVTGFPTNATLVVSLSWDTNSDLDLHVIDPSGTEVWSDKRSLFIEPPYGSPTPSLADIHSFGYLDFDSNSMCAIDGRREENAIWMGLPDAGPSAVSQGGVYPPPGHYTARIDTYSLCGQSAARWDVKAFLSGQLIAESFGQSGSAQTRPPHGAGAGINILEFDINADGGFSVP